MTTCHCVTSRKGRVSRNVEGEERTEEEAGVTSRKGRVSRNCDVGIDCLDVLHVTSRKGRVSRNPCASW